MSKIGLAICGSSGIDYVAQNHNMKVFRSIISIDGKDYKDYEDINSEQLYSLMKNATKISTSQTSTGELIQIVKDFKNQGYTDLIMITISSGLSGTYQNVCLSSRDRYSRNNEKGGFVTTISASLRSSILSGLSKEPLPFKIESTFFSFWIRYCTSARLIAPSLL